MSEGFYHRIIEYYKNPEWLLMIIALSMPLFPRITTICILFWAFLSILCYKREYYLNFIKKKDLLLYSLFYIGLIVGLICSMDPQNGWFKVQTQASMLVFPILLGGKTMTYAERLKLFNFFIAGTTIAVAICFLYGLYRYIDTDSLYLVDAFGRQQNLFFYSHFSEVLDLDPTYFSMYLGLSLFFLFVTPSQYLGVFGKVKPLLIFILMAANVLTSSKAGIIFFFLLIIAYFVFQIFRYKQKKFVYITLALLLAAGTILFSDTKASKRLTYAFHSLEKNILTPSHLNESTSIRWGLWKLSWNVAQKSLLFGYGTGSVESILNKECLKYNMFSVCESYRNKNSHNQYLNFLVSNGIIMLLIFMAALIYGLYRSYKKHDVLALSLVIFMMLNFITESLLQRERGIVFFMFFVVLLTISESRPILGKTK